MDNRERVARAICLACDENPEHVGDASGNDKRWQDYLHVADAAIEALAGDGMLVRLDRPEGYEDVHPQLVTAITREEALALAERMIAAARSYERPEYQAGYFEGLVAGWWQCGIIAADEMQTMRRRMRENLPTSQPAWWDLAARLGL